MIGERLKEIRKCLGLNQREFAEKLQCTPVSLSKYENGDLNVPDELKVRLSKLNVNIHWLVTGEGEMFRKNNNEDLKKENEELKKQIEELKGAIFYKPNKDASEIRSITLPEKINHNEIIEIDLLPFLASAGPGQDLTENSLTKSFPILKDLIFNKNAKAIIARGDSMTGISIFDGDFVFFVSETEASDGIYVFQLGNDLFIKRIVRDTLDGKLVIISENRLYPEEIRIRKVEKDSIKIIGKVIGWIHKHPY